MFNNKKGLHLGNDMQPFGTPSDMIGGFGGPVLPGNSLPFNNMMNGMMLNQMHNQQIPTNAFEPTVDIKVVKDIIELAKDAGAKEITMKFEDLAKLLIEASSGRLDVGIDKGFNMSSDVMFGYNNQFIHPMAPPTQGMSVVQAMQSPINMNIMGDTILNVIFLDDELNFTFHTPVNGMMMDRSIYINKNITFSFEEFRKAMNLITNTILKNDEMMAFSHSKHGDIFVKGRDILTVVGDSRTKNTDQCKLVYFNPEKHIIPVVIELKNYVSTDVESDIIESHFLNDLSENNNIYKEWLGEDISIKPTKDGIKPELFLTSPGVVFKEHLKGFGFHIIRLFLTKEINTAVEGGNIISLFVDNQAYNLVYNNETTIANINIKQNIKLNKNLLEVISR